MATLIDELFRYVGFGPEDGARLVAASAMMTPSFDAIVDRFYVAIDANPEARAVFEDDAQVARQKRMLRAWLVRFFAGPYDDSYYVERARIGRAHVRIGLPQRYVFVSMNIIRSGLTDAVASHAGPDADSVALQRSIHRLCDVELAIMLETYREDYDRALRAAERLATLGQFAGTVAHEMRNPLAVLSTSSHLLRRHAGEQANLLRHVDRIERQVAICGQIVDDLLALARDRAPSFEDVSLQPMIEFAWAQLPASPHALSLTIAEGCRSLQADPGQLRQVLVNLLQNATQAMGDPGEVSVDVSLAADKPSRLSFSPQPGRYRLEVKSTEADGPLTTMQFDVGWYSEGGADTPDLLETSIDKPEYQSGDTMVVTVNARSAGKLTVNVLGDRLLTTQSVDVKEGTQQVKLTVGQDWGSGAYVLATLRRPLDAAAQRMPGRAIGLKWFGIDKKARTLAVTLSPPSLVRPGSALKIPVKLAGLNPGEDAKVVIAAVDVGILNLTNYKPPAPDDYYLGQRRLTAEIRDLYGQLIDGMQGTRGQIRSGGDSAPPYQVEASPGFTMFEAARRIARCAAASRRRC